MLKRNIKLLWLFYIIYIKFVYEIKCILVFERSKRKIYEVYNMLLYVYWKEFIYFLIFSKCVVIFNVILNFFESFFINNVVIFFD